MIDHLVYATPDLAGSVDRMAERLGVRPSPGGRHPSLGTRNALLGLDGGAYLEIIAVDPEADGPAGDERPFSLFGLDGLAEPRLVSWAARASGIDDRVARSRAAGYDPGPVKPLSRRLPDGAELRWRLTPPPVPTASRTGRRDPVDLVPFLIEWDAGAPHPSTTAAPGCQLVSFNAGHPDPQEARRRLAALGVELAVTLRAAQELVAVITGPGGTVELR